jgi:hypothetical protein
MPVLRMEVCIPYQNAHSFHMRYYGYHTSVGELLAPTSQIRVSAMLSLLTAGYQKLRFGVVPVVSHTY